MKKVIITLAAALIAATSARAEVITLDLTKATTALEFDATNGSWNGTFDDEAESIDSQCFSFVHSSMGAYKTWWGFTASNSADNGRKDDTLTFQYSNMAKGGIVLNEDNTVKTDEYGAPVTSPDVPYIVAYYSAYMAARPVDMTFTDGKSYKAVGVYVNLNSYAYYSVECGDSFARAFTNGDKLTLTIHGVNPDGSEKTVDVALAEYANGCLTITRGWRYVDLSSLGIVNELYFTMTSTDSGAYGMNTPGYFCLDKLMVEPAEGASVSSVMSDGNTISYDRESHTVTLTGSDFAVVYDATGNKVMSSDSAEFSISHLDAGVYIVKAGNSTVKIAK